MCAPLIDNLPLASKIMQSAFKIPLEKVQEIQIEYVPGHKKKYLDDNNSFNVYVSGINLEGKVVGIGIEVKYTEQDYSMSKYGSEKKRVEDSNSIYWKTSIASKAFINPMNPIVKTNSLRQIWRNHLLGLSMVQARDIEIFYSATLFPNGNCHFHEALQKYRELLVPEHKKLFIGCTFEQYIDAIPEHGEYIVWKKYLFNRYIVR